RLGRTARGQPRPRRVWRAGRPGTPPPPLRGQQPAALAAGRARPAGVGHLPGRAPGGGDRAARPSVVRRQPVPPGVQVPAEPPPAALPRLRRRRRGAPLTAGLRRRDHHRVSPEGDPAAAAPVTAAGWDELLAHIREFADLYHTVSL